MKKSILLGVASVAVLLGFSLSAKAQSSNAYISVNNCVSDECWVSWDSAYYGSNVAIYVADANSDGTPKGEAKLVRCTSGSIYDVVIDLRPDSPTVKRWIAVRLTAQGNMIYRPEGCAHRFSYPGGRHRNVGILQSGISPRGSLG